MHFYILKQIIRNIINYLFYILRRVTRNLKSFIKFIITILIVLILLSIYRGLNYGY